MSVIYVAKSLRGMQCTSRKHLRTGSILWNALAGVCVRMRERGIQPSTWWSWIRRGRVTFLGWRSEEWGKLHLLLG